MEVSLKFLQELLCSEEFIQGLEVAVQKTRETGFETGFELRKTPGRQEIYYPENIILGDKTVLDPEERIFREFVRTRDKMLNANPESWTSMNNAPITYDEFCKKLAEEGIGPSFPYPEHDEKTYKATEEAYVLIDFHTHPSGNLHPSYADLACLSDNKIANYAIFNRAFRPIMIIAAVCHNKTYLTLTAEAAEHLVFDPARKRDIKFFRRITERGFLHFCMLVNSHKTYVPSHYISQGVFENGMLSLKGSLAKFMCE